MATGLLWSGWSGVHMPVGARDFYRLRDDHTDSGSIHHPIQFTLRVKRPRREVNHLSPSSSEVKNEWSYTAVSPICLIVWTERTLSSRLLIACLVFGVINCTFLLNTFQVIKERRQNWSGLIAHVWKTRNIYKHFVGKPQNERSAASFLIMDSLKGGGFYFSNSTNH
jgi:hypothetical protein